MKKKFNGQCEFITGESSPRNLRVQQDGLQCSEDRAAIRLRASSKVLARANSTFFSFAACHGCYLPGPFVSTDAPVPLARSIASTTY